MKASVSACCDAAYRAEETQGQRRLYCSTCGVLWAVFKSVERVTPPTHTAPKGLTITP